MAVYAICTYNIVDSKAYEPYVPSVMPILGRFGAEILAADFSATALEGTPASVQVILKFADEATALAWYNDPEYTQVKKIRLNATENGALVLVRGVPA